MTKFFNRLLLLACLMAADGGNGTGVPCKQG